MNRDGCTGADSEIGLCRVERDTTLRHKSAQECTPARETGKQNCCAETGQAAADEQLPARD